MSSPHGHKNLGCIYGHYLPHCDTKTYVICTQVDLEMPQRLKPAALQRKLISASTSIIQKPPTQHRASIHCSPAVDHSPRVGGADSHPKVETNWSSCISQTGLGTSGKFQIPVPTKWTAPLFSTLLEPSQLFFYNFPIPKHFSI